VPPSQIVTPAILHERYQFNTQQSDPSNLLSSESLPLIFFSPLRSPAAETQISQARCGGTPRGVKERSDVTYYDACGVKVRVIRADLTAWRTEQSYRFHLMCVMLAHAHVSTVLKTVCTR
jgi:hypothetical protein